MFRDKDPDLVPNKLNAETFIDVDAKVSVSQAKYPQQMRKYIATLRCEENIIENSGDEQDPIEGEPVVPPKNEEVQHALDVLLSASIFSAELGEELRKNALSYAKLYDRVNVMKKRQATTQDFLKAF